MQRRRVVYIEYTPQDIGKDGLNNARVAEVVHAPGEEPGTEGSIPSPSRKTR